MSSASFAASQQLASCPVCGSSDFLPHLECRDHIVSQQMFTLVKCSGCGLVFTNPRPDEREIGPYYESKDYLPHTGGSKSAVAVIYRIVRRWAIRRKLALLNSLAPKGRLLDIGCGTGEFLNHCRANGWDGFGVEPGDSARAIATQSGARVAPTFKREDYAPASLDVITMWHVMEHVHDLKGTVAAIAEILRPGGWLVVAVPNHTSYDATYYGRFWGAYDVPRHLSHFSPDSMRRLIEPVGLRHQQTRSMWFDSVYVSLMAERYQKADTVGSNNPIRAGFIGLLSNFRSLFRKETCSSQIYVFSRTEPMGN